MSRELQSASLQAESPIRGAHLTAATAYLAFAVRETGGNPLLVLHGGPGLSHDYLEDLAILADTGRPVVFYERAG